jgi:hypothetical protein
MAAFDGWTEYEKMSAANWRPNNGHHSAPHNYVVDIKDQEHPITKGLKLSFPQANDELYSNLRWQPAGSYHVLATAYDDHALYAASRTDAKAPAPTNRCCGRSISARDASSQPRSDTTSTRCRRRRS